MSKVFKKELAGQVLVEALYTTDKDACERYGISIRSLQNYRSRLATDTELALIFARRQKECYGLWVSEVPVALLKAIRFIGQAADAVGADANYRKNPMVIQSIASALKMVAEVHFANEIVSARLQENRDAGLSSTDRSSNELDKQIPSEPQVEYPC